MISTETEINQARSRENCLNVLRYWHQLEFFIPYNLDEALAKSTESFDISLPSLQGEKANNLLPWLNKKERPYHYQLYLLPFEKKELTQLSTRHFPVEFKQQNRIELEENLLDEGLTCFASLFIDKNGNPQWNKLSISTLPWAMGMLQSGEFGNLSEETYNRDIVLFQSAINLLKNQFENNKINEMKPGPFDANLLVNLLKALSQWARYSPDYPFVVVIKPILAKEEDNANFDDKIPSNLPIDPENNNQEEFSKETLSINDELDILNSFFIRDLEKTINYVANNSHLGLEAYINGNREKIDILATANQPLLLQQLQPRHTNMGRWPSPPSNFMSLMQQLCINQAFMTSSAQPILATNGPPGTGKTTLLKDIVAENIIQRAKALANFSSVSACFTKTKKIVLKDKKATISILNEKLTGFEMLVVSSNNTAVENISRELPLKTSLGSDYRESCQYLRPVAAKLVANHFSNRLQPPLPALQPWGLISIVLGNASNQQEFIQRFFWSPDKNTEADKRKQQGQYLNIWEWREQYKGCSFDEAKKAFLEAWKSAEKYKTSLQEFADVQIQYNTLSQKIAEQYQILKELQQEIESLIKEKDSIQMILQESKNRQDALYKEINQQLEFKPSFWKRLLRTEEAKLYKNTFINLQTRRFQLIEESLKLQQNLSQLAKIISEKQIIDKERNSYLEQIKLQFLDVHNKYLQLKSFFSSINIPSDSITEKDQIQSYWQSEEFNRLRSEVFICSLQLHEAWLAEALKDKYFGGNLFAINALLEGKSPLASTDELAIWQSLFMIIPVVSSTFASIRRQFKNINAHSLGWLLIDEAGQATPQSVVGALWRCKKAIVVGDPRQIEPIISLPQHLIEGVANQRFSSINPHWLPHVASIQTLADLASPLGSITQQKHQQEWVGIPLLVHRRCLDPMFSIANDIAYDNKMINARLVTNTTDFQLPASVWFDVAGKATDKQYVPAQIECLLKLFIWFYNFDKGLPRLFVITPFKQVRKYLKEAIQNQDNWVNQIDSQIPVPTQRDLSIWINKHIGTVHTFQGKEAEKVIFVLGADKEQKGAIRWASSKPNLLNVALTRATDRIYIIGEWELWADKPYFCKMSSVLERKDWLKVR